MVRKNCPDECALAFDSCARANFNKSEFLREFYKRAPRILSDLARTSPSKVSKGAFIIPINFLARLALSFSRCRQILTVILRQMRLAADPLLEQLQIVREPVRIFPQILHDLLHLFLVRSIQYARHFSGNRRKPSGFHNIYIFSEKHAGGPVSRKFDEPTFVFPPTESRGNRARFLLMGN